MFRPVRGAPLWVQNTPENGVFRRLARPAKRHYTFARRRLDWTCSLAINTAIHAHKALIFGCFCSLRLSVRTPPFHGGESGSIPLGSAINCNGLALPKTFWAVDVQYTPVDCPVLLARLSIP